MNPEIKKHIIALKDQGLGETGKNYLLSRANLAQPKTAAAFNKVAEKFAKDFNLEAKGLLMDAPKAKAKAKETK